jgi:uncharacterized protein (DUF58 family)
VTDLAATAGRPFRVTSDAFARTVGRITGTGRRSLSLARRAATAVRPLGWLVLGVAAGSFTVSALFGWGEAATLAALSLLLAAACAAFLFGRRVFDVQVDLRPPRVVVGERAFGRIALRSRAGHRLLPLRVDLVVGEGVATFDFASLAPGEEDEELFQIPTDRRGVVPVGPAQAVRADPVGLFSRVVSQSGVRQLYVHPRTVHVPSIGAGFVRDLEGRESQDRSPADIAFHSLREYRPGDDRRYVHWRTSARTRVLMVQEFLDTRRSHLLVALDDEAAGYATPDDFETAVSVVASVGVQAVLDGQVRSMVVGSRVVPTATRATMLDALAGIETVAVPGGPMRTAATGNRVAHDASLVVLVTGTGADPVDLRRAARRFRVGVRVAVVRVGPDPQGFRLVENVLLIDMSQLSELPAVMNMVVSA